LSLEPLAKIWLASFKMPPEQKCFVDFERECVAIYNVSNVPYSNPHMSENRGYEYII
jgi:hypothetical protein